MADMLPVSSILPAGFRADVLSSTLAAVLEADSFATPQSQPQITAWNAALSTAETLRPWIQGNAFARFGTAGQAWTVLDTRPLPTTEVRAEVYSAGNSTSPKNILPYAILAAGESTSPTTPWDVKSKTAEFAAVVQRASLQKTTSIRNLREITSFKSEIGQITYGKIKTEQKIGAINKIADSITSGLKKIAIDEMILRLRTFFDRTCPEFNPEQQTIIDAIDVENAYAAILDKPICDTVTVLVQTLSATTDVDLARQLVRDFREQLATITRSMERHSNDQVAEALRGLLAQQHGIQIDFTPANINEKTDEYKSRAEVLRQQANQLDNDNEEIRKSVYSLSEELRRLNREKQELDKQAEDKKRQAEGSSEPQQRKDLRVAEAALRLQSRSFNDRMRVVKEQIDQIQGPISELRAQANTLIQQANKFAHAEISRLLDILQRLNEAAEAEILTAFDTEGETLTNLVGSTLAFSQDDYVAFKHDWQYNNGNKFKAHRCKMYEILAEAAQLFRTSMVEDMERFSDPTIKTALPKKVIERHQLRRDMLAGMTLPPEQRDHRGFYAEEIPTDLNLPDRIPLFNRPHSEMDDAYRQSGEQPRYYDLALGTAVMFPREGEVNPNDKLIMVAYHGATTQKSNINSLSTWVTTFPKRYTQIVDGIETRKMTVVAVSNPFHEFGPYDPQMADMKKFMAWVDSIMSRYEGYDKARLGKGRSLGGNLMAEYARVYDRLPSVAMSVYNPTPYCSWYDFDSLRKLGRTFNETAVLWVNDLESQWTFHLPDQAPLQKPLTIMAGLKDAYLQETPKEYPIEFLAEYPNFIGTIPTDLGQLPFLELAKRHGGEQVRLLTYPTGKHFLYNFQDEDEDTRNAAYRDLGILVDEAIAAHEEYKQV